MNQVTTTRAVRGLMLAGLIASAAGMAAIAGEPEPPHRAYVVTPSTIAIVVEVEPPQHTGHSQTTIHTINDDGREYRLTILDGKVKVMLDGVVVESSNIIRKGDSIFVLGIDGESSAVFQVGSGGRSLVFQPDDGRVIEFETIEFAAPSVMVGINLSDPGESLRYHLGLDGDAAILIDHVFGGTPADRAGLKKWDVIVEIAGADEASGEGLRSVLKGKDPGDTLTVVVARGSHRVEINIELSAYDPFMLSAVPPTPDAPEWAVRADVPGAPQPPQLEFQLEGMDEDMRQTFKDAMRHAPDEAEIAKLIQRAMRQAGRGVQRFEFRGDRLIIPDVPEFDGEWNTRFEGWEAMGDEWGDQLESHMESLEQRLEAMEHELASRLEAAFERLEMLIQSLEERESEDD